ncbi:hypothetical protein CLOM_g23952 [Closterium sp. NIES-68]|nr:hypothetical protein CLOM_g23952 [Closterium sp. NIES-68]
MDSTTGAAAFTRRVLDLARRLAALGVSYPDPVLCCHLLEGLTPAFDTHKIAYMQLIDKRITPAEVAQWIITTEADLLRHSSSIAAVAQQRNTRGGRGGGRGAGRALSDEWFARGNTGTPPRWSSLSPRPTPQEVRTSPLFQPVSSPLAHQAVSQHQQQQQTPQQILPQPFQQQQQQFQQQQQQGQQHLFSQLQQQLQQLQQQLDLQSQLPLAPPPMASPQQPYPAWTAGTAASAAHLSGASPAPSATGSVTPFPSSGFVGMVSQAGTPAPSMYSAAINENVPSLVYTSPPSVLTSSPSDPCSRPVSPPSSQVALITASYTIPQVASSPVFPFVLSPAYIPFEFLVFPLPRQAYVLIHPADRPRTMGKLASRTLPCIFLGHNPSSPDYLFLHPPSGRFLRSRDVVFDESTPYYSTPPPTDPLAPAPRPLNWSDTIPPPLLPPPPILPPAPPPPFPAASVPSAPPSSGKWVFRVKQLPGEPPVYKARYVAKGFTQRYAVDFFDTFSPTAKPATIRAVLDLAARLNMEIHSMDVSNAFLQGVLRELIYMERPAGFHLPFPSDSVWQLRRPVYGLKQAPREWHAKLAATLAELGFSTSRADPSLFLRTSPSPFYILVYVDDMILITADSAELERVKRELGSRLKCKDLGELQHYLGMEITRNRAARTISLSQGHYLQQVLERFDMARGTPQVTPLPVGHHLTPLTSPSSSSHPYAELIGSLMYAMVSTRPDLTYPISVLARFVGTGKHDTTHWQAAKRVLRYLRGTKDYVLTLGGPSPPFLTGYSDSSWADSRPDRRSSQGYGFSLGSGLISWRSTRSSSIALSSCEAELYAATMAAQEARWLSFLLEELGAPQRCPTIWCDNASTIHLTKDAVFHGRSKHIELRHYFIRELVQGGHLRLGKIDSAANLADIFTKALPHAAHSSLLRLLGLAPPVPSSAS